MENWTLKPCLPKQLKLKRLLNRIHTADRLAMRTYALNATSDLAGNVVERTII